MAKQLKVVSKGYTVTCTSWENDGDNYRTKSVVVENKKLAEALYQMCEVLFQSENNSGDGLGNSSECDDDMRGMIADFIKKYPILMDENQHRELIEIEDEEEELEFYEQVCSNWIYKLLGNSEYYYCRVAETTTVSYSPEDIFVEQIL